MTKIKQTASKNERFVLDDQRNVFDKLHPELPSEPAFYMNPYTNKPYDDESRLRTGVLFRRLECLIPQLVRGNGRKRDRKTFSYEICGLLSDIIQASHLAAEYNMARAVDIGAGRGLDPGDGVSSMTVRNSLEPAEMLILRARKILSFESKYGRYTVCFAKALKGYWPAVHEWRPLAKTVSAAIAKLQMRCKYVNAVAK